MSEKERLRLSVLYDLYHTYFNSLGAIWRSSKVGNKYCIYRTFPDCIDMYPWILIPVENKE